MIESLQLLLDEHIEILHLLLYHSNLLIKYKFLRINSYFSKTLLNLICLVFYLALYDLEFQKIEEIFMKRDKYTQTLFVSCIHSCLLTFQNARYLIVMFLYSYRP